MHAVRVWVLTDQRCVLQLIVSVLTLFGVMTIPDIVREGGDFVQRLKSENAWVVVLEKLRHGIGCARCGKETDMSCMANTSSFLSDWHSRICHPSAYP